MHAVLQGHLLAAEQQRPPLRCAQMFLRYKLNATNDTAMPPPSPLPPPSP
jgi:hypothetical protein